MAELAPASLACAVAAGDRLVTTAVWHGDRCNWTGDEVAGDERLPSIVHRPVDAGLYSGGAGIARFLAHLWRATGRDAYRATALGALRRSWAEAERQTSTSFWTGNTGIACAFVEIGDVIGDRAIEAAGHELGRRIAERDVPAAIASPTAVLDIVGGLAGTITGLAFLVRRAGDRDHPVARACRAVALRLVTAAHRQPFGWSWPMDEAVASGRHLCGMAHGVAGIALALAEAGAVTGEAAWADAAWRGVEYEDCWFDRDASNWPDRRGAANGVFAAMWCHGAAGIGLARLRLHQLTGAPKALAGAQAALHATGRAARAYLTTGDSTTSACVCHGLGSLVDFWLAADRASGRDHLRPMAGAVLARAATQLVAPNGTWRSGVPNGGEHPGLMLGIAGIGMSYLALADRRVPSITMWS